MKGDGVYAMIVVDYPGTIITKAVTIQANGESNATNVNRAIEHLTKKVQSMVQSEQGGDMSDHPDGVWLENQINFYERHLKTLGPQPPGPSIFRDPAEADGLLAYYSGRLNSLNDARNAWLEVGK